MPSIPTNASIIGVLAAMTVLTIPGMGKHYRRPGRLIAQRSLRRRDIGSDELPVLIQVNDLTIIAQSR
jgi:hypothetical protein